MDTLSKEIVRAPPAKPSAVWPALLLLALAVGIMMYAGWSAQRTLTQMHLMTDARAQANRGRLHLEQVLSLFKDIESGSRGYALTGEGDYLAPYRSALLALPESYAKAKTALADHLPAGVTWTEIEALIEKRKARAANLIAHRQTFGTGVIMEVGLLDEGKQAMDLIRDRFAALDAHQIQRVTAFNSEIIALRQRADAGLVMRLALTLVLLLLAVYLTLRERRLRRALEMQLLQSNLHLEARVSERTRELLAAHERLTSFAAKQNRLIEQERRRLSREVHDQIGQVFTAIKLIADSVPPASFPAGQKEALAQALDMGIASTRRVTADLRPPLLDDLGLVAALDYYLEKLAGASALNRRVDVRDEGTLGEACALGLFRITQEAVTNILRHAQATAITITGRREEQGEGNTYVFTIGDNGRGFAAGAVRPDALGMAGMRERAALLGGVLSCSSDHGGTSIAVRIPLREKAHDENPAG